jgi:hypothetical protein
MSLAHCWLPLLAFAGLPSQKKLCDPDCHHLRSCLLEILLLTASMQCVWASFVPLGHVQYWKHNTERLHEPCCCSP